MKNTLKLITEAVNVALDKVRAEIPRETRELLYEFTEEDFITKTEIEVTKSGYNPSDEVAQYETRERLQGTYLFSLDDGEPVQIECNGYLSFNYESYVITFHNEEYITVGYPASLEEAPNIKLVKIESRERENLDEFQPAIKIINLTDNEADELLDANLEIEGSVFVKNFDTSEVGKVSLFNFYRDYSEAKDAKTFSITMEAYNGLIGCNTNAEVAVLKNFDSYNYEYSTGTNQLFLYTDCYEVESIRIYKVTKSSV